MKAIIKLSLALVLFSGILTSCKEKTTETTSETVVAEPMPSSSTETNTTVTDTVVVDSTRH